MILLKRLLLVVSVFMTAAASAMAKETLSLYVTPGYEHIPAYKESIDFISGVVKDAGYEVKLTEAPRKRGPTMVDNGEIDALPIRSAQDFPEAKNLINTSFPIAFTTFKVVALKKNSTFIESQLKKFQGAIVLNNFALKAEGQKRKLNIIEINNEYVDLLKMLQAGRVDYVIMPQEFIHSFLTSDKNLEKSLLVSKKSFVDLPLYFAINKNHKNALPKIEASFRKALRGNTDSLIYIKHSLNKHPSK
ncbi:ABC transporter substrate-binding protein [Bdellovibrio sp. NC01]|uniref:substrate-binding periplasmic protein n=1 Tax=Bdellovibrio sp. NC01 TaxID=2220073 RepID=UPI0011584BA6|nr:transporter substrate-binding domain-containing protein [Bdellovibrio sp. NC01]QDK38649.1 hypothetical protein DOE51_14185 [Bdellovibrio sp. NC01]